MGLLKLIKDVTLIDEVWPNLFGPKESEYEEGNFATVRQEAKENLNFARIFLPINIYSSRRNESRLYTLEEIGKKIRENGYAENAEKGMEKAQGLVKKGFISFYFASRGAAGVNIIPFMNISKDTKYKFRTYFCDDGS